MVSKIDIQGLHYQLILYHHLCLLFLKDQSIFEDMKYLIVGIFFKIL